MPRQISPATSLVTLRKEAKRWLRALRAHDAAARTRLERAFPSAPAVPTLRDVQHALARDHGYDSWIALRTAVAAAAGAPAAAAWTTLSVGEYERLARDLVAAFEAKDADALQRLNDHYRRAFTFEDVWAEIWRRVYAFRQRAFKGAPQALPLDEAQGVIAQDAGFQSWDALTHAVTVGAPRIPPYEIDAADGRIAPRRHLDDGEWDELLAVTKERGLTKLDAGGLMTDRIMARVAALEHVTTLSLGGSRELSDDGLLLLARMPQLERVSLTEYPGGKLTDRGLAVLRHLPNLRAFDMMWQSGITDAGVAHLAACDRLEDVSLMGSPTGDGLIAALQGKPRLRRLNTGRLVTDAGLALLRNIPLLRTWSGGEPDAGARLLIDGPFTNAGLAGLAGLEGVSDLDLFWHVTGITSDAFVHLREMPNLDTLGADGALSDDEAMRHFAAIPRLRKLRAQSAVASDDGFVALSQSRTLASIWGREWPNLRDRGFLALSTMPALHGLGVSCDRVSDEALARLPQFPALRELTPIGFPDDAFRHIGRCERLQRLTCMYCRDTTDAATAHIAGLSITYYYAGLTRITDRSLEILGGMSSLEQVELYEVNGVTDAGVAHLAGLPRLREVSLESLPGVTLAGTRVFPPHVRVRYST